MGNFFAWTFIYAVKLLIVAAFSAAGVFLGISLRKRKNKKLERKQEAQ